MDHVEDRILWLEEKIEKKDSFKVKNLKQERGKGLRLHKMTCILWS